MLMLVLLAACDFDNSNESSFLKTYMNAKPFNAEAIACEDLASPALVQKIRSDSKLSNMKHLSFEKEMQHMRKAADDGNLEMMLFYGYLLRMHDAVQQYGLREFCSTAPADRGIIQTLPLDTKNNVITGLSYFYASVDLVKNLPESDKIEIRKTMESSIYESEIPPAWIAEAKANAAKWREHCAKR